MAGLIRKYNLEHHTVLEDIKQMLSENAKHYFGVRVRCVAVKSKNEWRNGLCVIHAIPRNSETEKVENQRYDNVQLIEHWLKPKDLPGFLKQITNQVLKFKDDEVTLDQHTVFRELNYLAGYNNYSDYPGFSYTALKGENFNIPLEPLLAYDLPFYRDVFQAMANWCQIREFHGSNDAHIGSIIVFLAECRARLASLTREDNHVVIKTNMAEPTLANLRIKGGYTALSTTKSFEQDVAKEETRIEIPDDTEEFYCYLIDSRGRVYDYHQETRFLTVGQEHRLLTPDPLGTNDTAILELVNQGEGETLEFKPYIKPRNGKQEELIETVIAFANTKGGTILLGVDNHCVVTGIEKELYKRSKKKGEDHEKTLRRYIGKLRQTIAGTMKKTVQLEIKDSKVANHTVITINVPEGPDKLYSDIRNKKIYVRRGANNVLPDPDTELPQFFQKGPTTAP